MLLTKDFARRLTRQSRRDRTLRQTGHGKKSFQIQRCGDLVGQAVDLSLPLRAPFRQHDRSAQLPRRTRCAEKLVAKGIAVEDSM